jgi:hypothetical protein
MTLDNVSYGYGFSTGDCCEVKIMPDKQVLSRYNYMPYSSILRYFSLEISRFTTHSQLSPVPSCLSGNSLWGLCWEKFENIADS